MSSDVRPTEDLVLLDVEEGIGYITFNRAEKLNALSARMLTALDRRLDEAEENSAIRVVVLRGNGRAFSAGADVGVPEEGGDGLDEYGGDSMAHRRLILPILQRDLRIWDFPRPVIAQVHGHCLGIASRMATLCDITIVAEDAQIGAPRLVFGGGNIWPSWVHLVGPKRAKELAYVGGSSIDGKTAASWGWANTAVPADQLADTVRDLALRIAATPADIVTLEKVAANRMVEASGFRTAFLMGAETTPLSFRSPEVAEMRRQIQEIGLAEAVKSEKAH